MKRLLLNAGTDSGPSLRRGIKEMEYRPYDLDEDMKSYWIGRPPEENFFCPNVSLFRLLAQSTINLSGAKVIEFGFGGTDGSDLLEMHRRGASKCVGIDINGLFVEKFRDSAGGNSQIQAHTGDMGRMEYSAFSDQFDLAYSRDTIYYLTDVEIEHFFSGVFSILNTGGFLVIQFIEADLLIDENRKGKDSLRFRPDMFESSQAGRIHDESNPIRFLDPDLVNNIAVQEGLSLLDFKTHIQSYSTDDSLFRVDKYLLFVK